MSVEIPFWAVFLAVAVVLAAVAFEAVRAHLLREAIDERDNARRVRDKVRDELVKQWLEIAALKAAKPGVAPARPLPGVADGEAKLAAAVTEIRARTAVVRATTAAEREAAALAVVDGPDVTPYLPAQEPMHDAAELERLQPLAYVVAHGQRERREPPPPIQPEPVVTVEAETVAEVLEPVEVAEGDDDPPRDEARIIRRGRGEDEPPQGGRALTPFGLDGRPLNVPGRRQPLGPAKPMDHLPVVLPKGYLPAGWVRTLHRTVLAYVREPIRIDRRYSVLASTVRRLRTELMAWVESWEAEPGTHRRRDYVGGHRVVA